MKSRHLFIDLIRSASAVTTLATMLVAQPGFIFAASSGYERKKSEEAVKTLNHIIVIYQENWSFDSLYGQFPGASGYALGFDTLPQYDVAASPHYSQLIYKTPRPLTGFPLAADPHFPLARMAISVGGSITTWRCR